jgi:hypothetical protein
VNVLRDTNRALVPGGELLDFHPVWPPFAGVEAGGERLGRLVEPDFPAQLRATEAGMREAVRLGLFRRAASRTREIREHYDDADEVIDAWGESVLPELERRLRATAGPVQVVEKLVFRLYRTVA